MKTKVWCVISDYYENDPQLCSIHNSELAAQVECDEINGRFGASGMSDQMAWIYECELDTDKEKMFDTDWLRRGGDDEDSE